MGASERVVGGWSVTGEPDAYSDPYKDPTGPSFFRDMARARVGQPSAFAAASKSASALPIWTASEWARTSTTAPVTYVIHSSRGRSMTVPPSADGVRDAGTANHPSLATVPPLADGDTQERSSSGDDGRGVRGVHCRRCAFLRLACPLSNYGPRQGRRSVQPAPTRPPCLGRVGAAATVPHSLFAGPRRTVPLACRVLPRYVLPREAEPSALAGHIGASTDASKKRAHPGVTVVCRSKDRLRPSLT